MDEQCAYGETGTNPCPGPQREATEPFATEAALMRFAKIMGEELARAQTELRRLSEVVALLDVDRERAFQAEAFRRLNLPRNTAGHTEGHTDACMPDPERIFRRFQNAM